MILGAFGSILSSGLKDANTIIEGRHWYRAADTTTYHVPYAYGSLFAFPAGDANSGQIDQIFFSFNGDPNCRVWYRHGYSGSSGFQNIIWSSWKEFTLA